ncbi:hypothetical protein HanHA300_Chr16g0633971 [Helianthus annuus]|nr:hypothetical protein HanHA300_Chr16g0633971 [Helianthus annuus]KAJ0462599.1 hypothetical protein HanHA89_Chr16g0685141 [Helianthus annuus]
MIQGSALKYNAMKEIGKTPNNQHTAPEMLKFYKQIRIVHWI